MASIESSTIEQLRQAILSDGLCYQADSNIGGRVDKIVAKGFPFVKEEGLEFCKLSTFDNKRICAILESIFTWSALGCYKALADPNCTYTFLNNTRPEVQAVIIQLWSSNSRVVYYKGSHLQELAAVPAANGFLKIPPRNLAIDGIEQVEVEMEQGGQAVIDARLGFTIVQGLVINLGFANKEELNEWATMKLPNTKSIRDQVNAMTCERIGNNFELITP